MKLAEDVERRAGLGFKWSCRVPADAKKLDVPRHVCTAAKLQVDRVYAVCMDDDEVLVARLGSAAKAAWRMTQLHSQAKIFEGGTSKEKPIPFLE